MAAVTPKTLPPQALILEEAGLRSRVLVKEEPEYDAREASYWSNSAKIKPACFICPRSAEEVSTAVKALVAAGEKFAVRSGGRTNWAGASNIAGGVTIDLGFINFTTFDAGSGTACIGPGARWLEVYAELHKHGRVVAGGRDGKVGVAGLLLGGGNTFFTARCGFACDQVVSYEVVLADGRIVVADNQTHPDLYRVLKGGGNNFGIVTKFIMKTIKCDRIWGGLAFYPKQAIPAGIEALSEFITKIPDYPDSHLMFLIAHLPNFKDIVITTVMADTTGAEKAPAYDKLLPLPKIVDMCKMTSVSGMALEYEVPGGFHDVWFTLTLKNDKRIIAKAAELHEQMVEELKAHIPEQDFTTQAMFQPLPKLLAECSAAAGGNVMGLERQQHDGFLFLASAGVSTPELEQFAYPKVKALVETLRDFAVTIEGGVFDWVYLNYADKSQDPLKSYGEGNVRLMKEVAAKYDSGGVFQKLCPGGFKISQVA